MTCICVLGMHRSGTSCLTGIMQRFGVELGDVFTENPFNKKGNRENSRIVSLNDALLEYNGGSWYAPVEVSRWSKEHCAERDAIIDELQARSAEFWGFKDTRTLFALNFWEEAIGTAKMIGTFRHPYRVALSLNNRDKAPIENCWNIWLAYNNRLLELARQRGFALVDFDLPPDEYLSDTIAKLVALGLDGSNADAARDFFDSGLRNQTSSPIDESVIPQQVSQLYSELQNKHRNN